MLVSETNGILVLLAMLRTDTDAFAAELLTTVMVLLLLISCAVKACVPPGLLLLLHRISPIRLLPTLFPVPRVLITTLSAPVLGLFRNVVGLAVDMSVFSMTLVAVVFDRFSMVSRLRVAAARAPRTAPLLLRSRRPTRWWLVGVILCGGTGWL